MDDIYDQILDRETNAQPAAPEAPGFDVYDQILDDMGAGGTSPSDTPLDEWANEPRRSMRTIVTSRGPREIVELHDQWPESNGAKDRALSLAMGPILEGASKGGPDRTAAAYGLAKSTGLPVEVVERNLEEVTRRERVKRMRALLEFSPVLAKQMREPEFARLAHDDAEPLGGIEAALQPITRPLRSAAAGLTFDVSSGFYGVLETGAKLVAPLADPLAGTILPENPLRRVAAGLEAWRKSQQAMGDKVAGDTADAGLIERGVLSGFRSFGAMGPGLAATVATGNPAFALGSAGLMAGSDAATKALDKGLSPLMALGYGAADATAEIATEAIPVSRLLKDLDRGAGFFTTLARQIAVDVPTEMAATAWQNLNEWAILNPEKTLADWAAEQPDAQAQTVVASITMSVLSAGLGSVTRSALQRSQRAQQDAQRAQEDGDTLQALTDAAEGSKLRERAPDLFAQFVDQASQGSRVTEVFIDAEALANALGQDLPTMRETVPSIAEQIDEALATGGVVQIPVGEFAAHLAGKPYTAALIDQVRTVADGANRAEAAALFQSDHMQAVGVELGEGLFEQEPAMMREAEAKAIEAMVLDQFNAAGRFSPEVNRIYSALPAAFFRTMADRLGTTPAALFEQRGLTVARETLMTPEQRLDQGERGAFIPDNNTLVLMKGADLSTALHEMGHYFLESYADLAGTAEALQGDMQTVLDWFGVSDLATWKQMSLEQKRRHHEQFARGFESYLMEGTAPSLELQTMFARFSAWLTSVYRSLRGLNVELSDEVREVFDRMLATQEEIDTAQRARAMRPIFTSAEDAAAFGVDWTEYQRQADDASAEALTNMQARSLKDMTWAGKLRDETIKRLNRDAADKRKELRRAVEAEVKQEPVYRAQRWLKRGEMTTAEGEEITASAGHRLSIPALKAMYPAGALDAVQWEKLGYGAFGMLAEDGMHPDQVAELFGYRSGDAMVREILEAPPMREAVEALTDLRMLEQYGDLTSPDAIAKAADEAIHNDVRTRFLATELAGLQKAMGSARMLERMAKDAAAAMVEKLPAGKIRPTKYAAAEVKAGKAAEAALKAGNVQEAIRHKRNQIINHAATRAAYQAQAAAQKTLARFRQIATANRDQVTKSRNADIANAARAILAEYGVGTRGNKPRQYMEAVKAYDPELYAVLEPMLLEAEANAKPLESLTVAELRALADNIESLWYLARREKLVEIDGQLVAREQITEGLVGRLEALGVPETVPGEDRAPTEGDKRVRYLMGARAAMRRVESWVDRMDGGKITGAFRRFVWTPVSEAADAYRTDAGRYLAQYRDLLKSIEPTLKAGKIAAPELGYTFGYSKGDAGMAEVLHALLHTGNESNKRKLLLGRGWAVEAAPGVLDTSRWDAFVRRLIAEGKLTKAHFDFVQGVWDLLESMKPLAQKTHRDVFGRYFDEITAQEVATPWGVYRGGYVPAIADTFTVQDAAINAELEALNEGNGYMFPSTNRGFTKSRVEYNKPLLLDLRLLPQHIDKVLLFAHMEPKVRDVMRTLRAKGFSGTLTRYDPVAYTDLLLPWLNRAAKQTVETPATGWAGKLSDRFFRTMRSRSGLAAMFANLTNALQQVTGLSLTAVKVKPAYLKAALMRYVRAPSEVADQVAALSPFMENRLRNQVFEIRQDIDHLLLNPGRYEQAQAWTAKHGYFLQQAFQNVVDVITWAGAFDQATAEGLNQADAVRAANSAVRETQGSLSPEDISRFESGPAFTRLFTQFQSYFNMMANLTGTELAKVAQEVGLRAGAGRMFYILLLAFLVPAWLSEAIVQGMRGGIDDEDDDGYLDEFMAFFFGAPLRTAAATVPVVGQAGMVAYNAFNRKPYDDRMSTAPAVSMLESAASAPNSLYKAIAEDGNWRRAARDTLTLVTLTTGLPAAALGRPIGYAADVAQGRVDPTGPVDAVRGLVTGTASEESRR
ncbi:MAG TPA: hypothetical protein PLO71_05805 [Thauera phenylacetica]|jgi:hypothetical protein|nr:hypothetical protein [Thauera phenylacetica]